MNTRQNTSTKLWARPSPELNASRFEDFTLSGYDPHPAIRDIPVLT